MKVAGFTFIRNAIRFDYPVEASIRSILPLCDKVYVAVGKSDDETLALVRSIDPEKIVIQETVWDDSLREGGRVLALETDKAYAMIPEDADWCIYIQADEVIHEQDYPAIREGMKQWMDNPDVEGLLFRYRHFYGSYDYIGTSGQWYKHEVRIVRKRPDLFSYQDAQGFRILPNRKLKVKTIPATMHHYGWVKHPEKQQHKQEYFHKLWHDDQWVKKHVPSSHEFDYSTIDLLERYTGTHPMTIQPWVNKVNWKFEADITRMRKPWKDRFKDMLRRITGKSLGVYTNYDLMD